MKDTIRAAAAIVAAALLLLFLAPQAIAGEKPEKDALNTWSTEDGSRYFTCPVMKGEGRVGAHEGTSSHDGKLVFHCCPPCQAPFRANPEKYLSALHLPGNIARVDEEGKKHFRDPVSGEVHMLSDGAVHRDHEGRRYYFASEEHAEQFSEVPGRYLDQLAEHRQPAGE